MKAYESFSTVKLAKEADYEEISRAVKEAADGPMKGILGWTDEEVRTMRCGVAIMHERSELAEISCLCWIFQIIALLCDRVKVVEPT